jgi:hypothetical protein
MTSILLSLDVIRLTSEDAECSGSECPLCAGLLAIHQPDEQLPDHLLGTCMECQTWFLIDEAEGLMLRLPKVEAVRDASSSPRGAVA